MHYLTKVKKIVAKYLEGNLTQLKFKYISDRNYDIIVRYSNQWDYMCEYKLTANELNETKEYCYHTCNCRLERVDLQQEVVFEDELLAVLRKNTLEDSVSEKEEETG